MIFHSDNRNTTNVWHVQSAFTSGRKLNFRRKVFLRPYLQ